MSGIFWADSKSKTGWNYQQLDQEIRALQSLPTILQEHNNFRLWSILLRSILQEHSITLVDASAAPTEEPLNLNGTQEQGLKLADPGRSLADLNAGWRPNRWSLSLHTSGTTGRPKKVSHSLETITKAVKAEIHHRDDVWAFCYHPTHFAGLQVFFQALINQNPMIYLFDEEPTAAWHAINDFKVTRISATPTFYRRLLTGVPRVSETVKSVAMGGERFDPRLERQLSGFFPNARFRNIYASTEAGSLFSSNGDTWRIPEDLTKFVKTSPDGELLLHRDILASFEWNQNSGDTDWYRTGDLVEIFGPDEFRIVGRLVEQINVGGFKVNPHEVETEIRSVAGVVDCRVFGRSNSVVGNIVCVDVVSESSVDTKSIELLIRTRLGKVFQPWQIPRVFRFVEHLESSKSGKVKRL